MNLHSPMRRSRCTTLQRLKLQRSSVNADLVKGSDLSEATRKTARFSLSTWSSPFNAVSVRETFPLCNLSIHLLRNFSAHERDAKELVVDGLQQHSMMSLRTISQHQLVGLHHVQSTRALSTTVWSPLISRQVGCGPQHFQLQSHATRYGCILPRASSC